MSNMIQKNCNTNILSSNYQVSWNFSTQNFKNAKLARMPVGASISFTNSAKPAGAFPVQVDNTNKMMTELICKDSSNKANIQYNFFMNSN